MINDLNYHFEPKPKSKEVWASRILIAFGFFIFISSLHFYSKIYEPYLERVRQRNNQFNTLGEKRELNEPILITSYIRGRDFVINGIASAKEQVKQRKAFYDYYLIRRNNAKNKNLAMESGLDQPLVSWPENGPAHQLNNLVLLPDDARDHTSERIKVKDQKFELMIDNKPLYIKGVCYNTGLDRKNGMVHLTRDLLTKDFQLIKNIGANTITRDFQGQYDYNIVKIAQEEGLKVILGFQFEPETDYASDRDQLNKYLADVKKTVKRYEGNKTVIGYTVGHKLWEEFKFHHPFPYYTKIRAEYVKFINEVAKLIHANDPEKLVFTVSEFSPEFPSEIASYKKNAPEIDVIAVSAFYEEQLSVINEYFVKINSHQPYLIYEYGPRGHWKNKYINNQYAVAVEESSFTKANNYKDFWNQYIEAHRGSNVGGVAYAWRDVLSGSATWFGITDSQGRKKPAYYALFEAWTKNLVGFPLPDIDIVTNGKLLGSNTFEFSIDLSGKFEPSKHVIQWKLYKYDFLKETGEIATIDQGQKARVTIPSEPAPYRLYVEVTDHQGNIVTASKPILLDKN